MTTTDTHTDPDLPSTTTDRSAHDGEVRSAGRVVVGVDGSASSVQALRWAGRTASALGLEIDAVTSWSQPTSYGYAGGTGDWNPKDDADAVARRSRDEAFGEHRPTGLRTVVREGHPARVLVEASRDAAMLVVGTRGHGGFAGLLLGSVSGYCAEHAHCPTVVNHEAGADAEAAT